jgi:hypothetical protein
MVVRGGPHVRIREEGAVRKGCDRSFRGPESVQRHRSFSSSCFVGAIGADVTGEESQVGIHAEFRRTASAAVKPNRLAMTVDCDDGTRRNCKGGKFVEV